MATLAEIEKRLVEIRAAHPYTSYIDSHCWNVGCYNYGKSVVFCEHEVER